VIGRPCQANADCDPDQICSNADVCVADPNGSCTDSSDCGDFVCEDGSCVACSDDTQCGAGRRCAPDGSCVTASLPPPGDAGVGDGGTGDAGPDLSIADSEAIQGGACTCSLPGAGWHLGRYAGSLGIAAMAFAWFARRRRGGQRSDS
jgi:hypothetical protein